MRNNYDFSNGRKNPYAAKLKKQITINISEAALDYFKEMSDKTGLPYQSIINLYLIDCANNKRQLTFI